MKKIITAFAIAVASMGILVGCSSAGAKQDDGKVQIVATIFPEYDWVKNILGDNPADMELSLLLDDGVDLHSFQPSAEDILNISRSDIFIYVGGESDRWVDDVLSQAVNKDMKVINLLDVLNEQLKEEEIKEGMQAEEGEEEDEEETEYDEHVWLSLRNASVVCDKIKEALCEADPDNSRVYEANYDDYASKLSALDKEYEDAVASSKNKTVVFADRFPFRYMTDDYGLEYYAAFAGCSAETEASFKTVSFLANKVDELGLGAVLKIEGANTDIAETIIGSTKAADQKILTIDSMQAVTKEEAEGGKTYLSVMEDDLEVLREALK